MNADDIYTEMKYDYWCGKCSSGIKCYIYNKETEEEITIDATENDVKKLYDVLREFFKNGEKDVMSEAF